MAKPVDLVIRVKADTGEVAPGMKALDNELDQATKSAKALDKELADVSKHDIDLDVNTQAIKAARDRIDDLRDDIANTKALDIEADTSAAEKEIAKLKRSIKALAEDSPPIDLGGGEDIGGKFSEGLDHASEGLTEFQGEADGTAREVAASFDGSIESIAGGFQELAANALGGFGPAGAIAGLAMAAGIGLGVQALTKAADAANAAKQAVVDLAAEVRDAGGSVDDLDWSTKFEDFADTVVDTKSWFEVWQKDSTTALERSAEVARKTGVSFEDIFKGMAGDVPAATRAIGDLDKRIAEQQKVVDNLTTATGGYNTELGQANARQQDALHNLKGYRSELEDSIGTVTDAIERNKVFAEAMGETVEAYQKRIAAEEDARAASEADAAALKAQEQAYKDMVQGIADPVTTYQALLDQANTAEQTRAQTVADGTEDSADSWEDYANSVTVSTQQLIDDWNRQAEQTKKFETNLATIAAAGGQALADELRAKGPEVAGAVAEVIATADPATQKAAIEAHANALGAAVGDGIAEGVSQKEQEVQNAIRKLFNGITAPTVPFYLQGRGVAGAPASGVQSVAPQAMAGNVRVYIDGNELRATVRTDISAAAGRAALVGAGRSRP